MKSVNVILLILLSVLAVIVVSGCSDNSEQTYTIGASTFKLPGTWEQTANTNGTEISRAIYTKNSVTITISKYNNQANYNIDYENALSNYNTIQTDISGITVNQLNIGTNNYLYFFQKDNSFYSVNINGYTEPNANKTINTIVSTIN